MSFVGGWLELIPLAAIPLVAFYSVFANGGINAARSVGLNSDFLLVVVGLILGPMADSALRRSLQMSLGDPMILLQHPGSAAMIAIAAIALLAPFVFKGLARFRHDED